MRAGLLYDEKTKEMHCVCLKAANGCIDLNGKMTGDGWIELRLMIER